MSTPTQAKVSQRRSRRGLSIQRSDYLSRLTTSVFVTMYSKLRSRYDKHNGVLYTLSTNNFILQNGAKNLWNQTDECNSRFKAYISCYSEVPGTSPLTFVSYHRERAVSTFPWVHEHTYIKSSTRSSPTIHFPALWNSTLLSLLMRNVSTPKRSPIYHWSKIVSPETKSHP
jgi:hypothetical protein